MGAGINYYRAAFRANPLAQAHIQLVAAWQVAQHAAWRYDQGLDCGEAAQSAKYLAAEASFLERFLTACDAAKFAPPAAGAEPSRAAAADLRAWLRRQS